MKDQILMPEEQEMKKLDNVMIECKKDICNATRNR